MKKGAWSQCVVESHLPGGSTGADHYRLHWKGQSKLEVVPRWAAFGRPVLTRGCSILVVFDAESPFLYVERLGRAIQNRKQVLDFLVRPARAWPVV